MVRLIICTIIEKHLVKNNKHSSTAFSQLCTQFFSGETLLHSACKKGNVSRLTAILASPNVMVNAKDNLGWTPMHEATSKGHLECVKKLLNYKPATIKSFFTPSKKGNRYI